jgi:hypothetical protein
VNKPITQTTRLLEFITALYPWTHGHQKKALCDFIAALLEIKSCTQAKLAGAFENKVAAARRLTRLLHNQRLRTDDLAEGVAQQFVAHLGRYAWVRIALDWTVENGQHLLVASAVIGRRAVPIYWRAYTEGTLKTHRSQLEQAFVKRLFTIILRDVARAKIVFTADRGFADIRLMQCLDELRIGFVIRTKENVKVFWQGRWRKLKELRMRGNTRCRSLGRLRYCARAPRRYYLTQSRARNRQGRWGFWNLVSNRHWSAGRTKQEYERRWGCECGFRDAKHLLGLKEADIANAQAYARMFTLVAVALLLLAIIGCAFLTASPHLAVQRLRRTCSSRSPHSELSLFAAVLHLLKHARDLWDYLIPQAQLNLDASLPNVS